MNNSQEVMKIIKNLAKEQDKTVGKMLDDCGLSKNALSSMKSGYLPRIENLAKIADYLEVSVDYLLGRDEPYDSRPEFPPKPKQWRGATKGHRLSGAKIIKKAPDNNAESEHEILSIKTTKSEWEKILNAMSDENRRRLEEYAELLLLKQDQDDQED